MRNKPEVSTHLARGCSGVRKDGSEGDDLGRVAAAGRQGCARSKRDERVTSRGWAIDTWGVVTRVATERNESARHVTGDGGDGEILQSKASAGCN